MSSETHQARLEAERRETTSRQARAADPAVSAWVSANAGTGKTHVLTTRVLRLLVAGTAPERLLCLTYTKAAAAEMSSRVFERLAGWVTDADDELDRALGNLLGRPPHPEETGRARDLFTRAIETPGGLKVQTIHAFCERLLQRFPLEAGVPPGFAILDEEMRATLIRESTDAVLRSATGTPHSPLGRALAAAIRFANDDSFDGVLDQALGRRDWLEVASRLNLGGKRELEAAADLYRRTLDLDPKDTMSRIEADLASVLPDATMARARDVLRTGTATDAKRAVELSQALGANAPETRIEALMDFFLTGKGEPRSSLMTAKLRTANPDLEAQLTSAQGRFAALHQKRGRLVVADATLALLRLASSVMQGYHDRKQQRAALDFDDLIRAAGNLLRLGEDAQWVLYKLDGGLDHILVDEAQDTSPTQWTVVESLAREFFAGTGSREIETGGPRTVFAVGDEKQSIYGFQGAAPKMFDDMGKRFAAEATSTGLAFERIPLTLSFRTVAPVLEAVDRIFADPGRAKGLTASGDVQRHSANRLGMGGLVELWDTEKPDDIPASAVWSPLQDVTPALPATRLADRIADTIQGWLTNGERLASEDRPLTAGDILILVRRRRPFADLMVAALKARRIPVAGADRLRLTDQLAVQDLMALCDVLLLPEDDLALASVLKSPLFGLDDNDLMAIAPARRGSLWSALLAAARDNPRFTPAAEAMKRWRSRSDIVPPYEFLVEVLIHDGMREHLLARLGPEAADPIDELLALALSYDDQAPPSLQGFMTWAHAADREIKRDMEHGRNEVRVMTVHGSKGLEAPIVFLPDTCSAPSSNRPGGLLAFQTGDTVPDLGAEPFLWPVKGSSGVEAVRSARNSARDKEAEEHNRLLYVALTRPRDRLYVAGFESENGRGAGCWYDSIEAGLADVLVQTTDAAGRPVRRLEAPQLVPPKPRHTATTEIAEAAPLPDWATRPAPKEPGLAVPLAPSRLAPLETDAEGDPVDPPPTPRRTEARSPSPRGLADGHRFLRGTLTHALLQHLPSRPPADWEAAATGFVAARGPALSQRARSSIVAETLAVLTDPAFGHVFGPDSRAEVPIAAEIPSPYDNGQPIRLTGQIDRLVVHGGEVLIVDFKTNRPPPTDAADVPDTYLLQLAAYRLAVSRVFALPVRAALLWTDGPHLMELPADRLDDAVSRLFKLAGAGRGQP